MSENHEHVFLKCRWPKQIMDQVMQTFSFDIKHNSIDAELIRINKLSKLKHPTHRIYVIVWIEMMYQFG